MKRILIASIVLALAGNAFAQAVIYNPSNTPTTGGTNSWPFNVYTDWRFSFIINKSVLGTGPYKITDIAFAPTQTMAWTASQFQMRMGHTALSTYAATTPPAFDTVLGSCPTIVYDAPMTWNTTAANWSDIGMQCTFGWDGKRNVCCELRYKNRSTSTGLTIKTDASINRSYTHNNYSQDPYNEPNWFVPIPGEALGPKHRIKTDGTNVLIASDAVNLGGTAGIGIFSAPQGVFYQIAASLGQTPFKVGPFTICLTPDALFSASAGGTLPGTFSNYAGTTSASGTASARLNVPKVPALVGVCVYHAAGLVSGANIVGTTNTDGTEIVP